MPYPITTVITALFTAIGLTFLWAGLSESRRIKLLTAALEKIKGFALDLIFEAEKLYKGGTGKFKQAFVINCILSGPFYATLPACVQRLITFEILSRLIDDLVEAVFNAQKRDNAAVNERLGD